MKECVNKNWNEIEIAPLHQISFTLCSKLNSNSYISDYIFPDSSFVRCVFVRIFAHKHCINMYGIVATINVCVFFLYMSRENENHLYFMAEWHHLQNAFDNVGSLPTDDKLMNMLFVNAGENKTTNNEEATTNRKWTNENRMNFYSSSLYEPLRFQLIGIHLL